MAFIQLTQGLHKKAKKIKQIEYDEMLEMASLGSKVMQPTSVQDAKLNNINISVKSSFINKPGTLITKSFKKKNLAIKLLLEYLQQKMMPR